MLDSECRIANVGFGNVRFGISDLECWIRNVGFGMSDSDFWNVDSECRIQQIQNVGLGMSDLEISDFEFRTRYSRFGIPGLSLFPH